MLSALSMAGRAASSGIMGAGRRKSQMRPPKKRYSSEEEDGTADKRRQRQRKTGFTAGAAVAADTPAGQQSQTPAEIGEDPCT